MEPSREVTNILTRGSPVMKGATDFTDFQKRVDFIHIAFQISQRSFTEFSKGFILAPSLFLG